VHGDVDDLSVKSSDAVDGSKWSEMIRGNWSASSSDSDAESWIQIARF